MMKLRTIKGANWRGVELVRFNSLNGTPHVVIEAVDPGFERSMHLYPAAQVEEVTEEDMVNAGEPMGLFRTFGVKPPRPFGVDGVHVAGVGIVSAEEFERLKNAT